MVLHLAAVSLIAAAALAHPQLERRQEGPVDPSTSADCTWYDTAYDKTYNCDYFESIWALTHEEFVTANPSVLDDCSGIVVGNSYCVEVNYGNPLPTSTSAEPTGTATPVPSPTQSGLISSCVSYYKAASGDTCDGITAKYGTFTTSEFISWNPAVGSACSGLWPEYYYCVGIPSTPTQPTGTPTATTTAGPSPTQTGIISSCVNYYKAASGDTCDGITAKYGTFTTAEFISWNPAVGSACSGLWPEYYYCVGIPSTPTTPTGTTTATATAGPSPTQTGIISSCVSYYKAASGDTCDKIVAKYASLTTADFISWNPAVGSTCSGIWPEYYYCVGISSTSTTKTTTTTTTTSGPSPTQTGIIKTCTTYQKAVNGDTCAGIVKEHGTFTLAQFLTWNPAVGSDCSGLLVGNYYCIGIPGTPTSSTTTSTTTAGCASAPTPTQPGGICACKKWHKVVDGNNCETIIKQYGITAANFNKWNPQVGTTCSTLWLGYYVCVGA